MLSYPVLWCVKTRVCSMVSDPPSQLTAVFVSSGNGPPPHTLWVAVHVNISYHTIHGHVVL